MLKTKKADVDQCLLAREEKKKKSQKRLYLGYFGCNLQVFSNALEIECYLTVSRFILKLKSSETLSSSVKEAKKSWKRVKYSSF
jgi:hypothetical protein